MEVEGGSEGISFALTPFSHFLIAGKCKFGAGQFPLNIRGMAGEFEAREGGEGFPQTC